MWIALEKLRNSISLKWNEETIIDRFDEKIQTDRQFYPSDYVLELQAVKTLFDFHHYLNNDLNNELNKKICTKYFIIADELAAQISYYRKIYQLLRNFVDNRLIELGRLLENQESTTIVDSSLYSRNRNVFEMASNWYEDSGRDVLTYLDGDYKTFVKNIFGVTFKTLKDYIQALSRFKNQNDFDRKISRIKQFWICLSKSSESFNSNLSEIEKLQNNFSTFKPFKHFSNNLIDDYNNLIDRLRNLPNNSLAKSCCNKNNGNCVAIMQAGNEKWFTLSGLDDTNVLAESDDKIYELGQQLSMPEFKYARLTGDVLRYTIYMGTDPITHKDYNHPFLHNYVELSNDQDIQTQGKEYTCCERKLLACVPNAQKYNFFIKYKPCKRCLPAMAHDNIVSNIYATEKGFYDQNETIKTITVEDLGGRAFRIYEHFVIEKDY